MTGRDIYLEILRVQTNILESQKHYSNSVTEEWKVKFSEEIGGLYRRMADLMNTEYDLKL